MGIDVGTSGCRAVAVDRQGRQQGLSVVAMPAPNRQGVAIDQESAIWWAGVERALLGLLDQCDRKAVKAVAFDGTSGTLLLTDDAGAPLGPGLMYNDARSIDEAARIKTAAPVTSGALGTTSALAKLLHLDAMGATNGAAHALHQADWIAAKLSGRFGFSDQNNALKLGYDVVEQCWPSWIGKLGLRPQLFPKVLVPGTPIGRITTERADAFGLSSDVLIVSGTTDGVAAFLATGAAKPGDAVTSLGSTLVVKQLTDQPLFDADSGIYSHRLGNLWLPGGASNSGGAALAQFFDVDTIDRLSSELRPEEPTGLDFYPLPGVGERFPINDPTKPSVTAPRPRDDAVFLQALLEGIAAIEQLAYQRLQALGAPSLRSVRTVGGGAANAGWTAIRRAYLGVPMLEADNTEAAFGAARLAKKGYDNA